MGEPAVKQYMTGIVKQVSEFLRISKFSIFHFREQLHLV